MVPWVKGPSPLPGEAEARNDGSCPGSPNEVGESRGRPTDAASVLKSPATGGPRPRGDRAEQADRCASLRRAGGDDGRRGADPRAATGRDPGENPRRGRG